ncbi:MAG: XdhC/CoxI family protein [Bacteroidota bacterium]
MIHEFKNLIQEYKKANSLGLKSVMASVVSLEGSSYRRPGVRMLITENGLMFGEVSGGCVEKEILKQSTSVFKTGKPKMITYDGRYRLGCDGIIYILIESFVPDNEMLISFENSQKHRKSFKINSFYSKKVGIGEVWGSVIDFGNGKQFPFANSKKPQLENNTSTEVFSQIMKPAFRLIIIGAEHDAVQLCLFASLLGWEVTVVASPSDPQTIENFPGANELIHILPELFQTDFIKDNIAVVLMTHNYAKDLKFLIQLKETLPFYIGLLGSAKRRDQLLNELIEYYPEVKDTFLDLIHGPAGINIGAETPQEVSLSICSEILAVTRQQDPKSLKDKTGAIHSDVILYR